VRRNGETIARILPHSDRAVQIRAIEGIHKDETIGLIAGRDIPHRDVISVMQDLRSAGFKQVQFGM
jgi:biopolymer transport protein ExbD